MRIDYLGAGTWGFCLASLLASKGNQSPPFGQPTQSLQKTLSKTREHPKLPKVKADDRVEFTSDLKHALEGAELLIESVTSKGIRPVFEQVLAFGGVDCPIVITSKGIEQNSGLLFARSGCPGAWGGDAKKHLLSQWSKPC